MSLATDGFSAMINALPILTWPFFKPRDGVYATYFFIYGQLIFPKGAGKPPKCGQNERSFSGWAFSQKKAVK
jgi:hypothetical protein